MFNKLFCLLRRDDLVRPREVPVQEFCALAICHLAIDFEQSSWWMSLSHCSGTFDIEARRNALARHRAGAHLLARRLTAVLVRLNDEVAIVAHMHLRPNAQGKRRRSPEGAEGAQLGLAWSCYFP
jgi:hypothetical protein